MESLALSCVVIPWNHPSRLPVPRPPRVISVTGLAQIDGVGSDIGGRESRKHSPHALCVANPSHCPVVLAVGSASIHRANSCGHFPVMRSGGRDLAVFSG